jgi:hypothetical protein
MSKTRSVPYTPALATPDGWLWRCAWCGQVATDHEGTWDRAIDALMDDHTPDCAAYQLWLKALEKGTVQKTRKRRKPVYSLDEQLAFGSLTT